MDTPQGIENKVNSVLDTTQDVLHSTYINMAKKLKQPSNKTWRPTPADRQLLRDLQLKTGIMAEVELIRMGLRKLAQSEGIGANGISGADLG